MPTADIRPVDPNYDANFKKCESYIHIGMFFDGTGNNKELDYRAYRDSNIARLFNAYRDDKIQGYFRQYVPGVGTNFTEIGEKGESWLGQGCGVGCEARVMFGLLMVLDALHRRSLSGAYLFEDDEIQALCRNTDARSEMGDRVLARLDKKYHGKLPSLVHESDLRKFLQRLATALEIRLRDGKPRTVECFLDVFGFSRGAAEARVFCRWLNDLLVNGKLSGIPIRFRFVGLMDTVASAGVLSATEAFITKNTGGHSGWAQAEFLRVPHSFENCIHMVAMHELRKNFPLDEVGINGVLPPNCHQYAYPGSHSDVGGGYEPGELGVSIGTNPLESDSLKLSQIPLNHMLDCAIKAGSPMNRPLVAAGHHDPFAIHPRVAQAYESFLSATTTAPRTMSEWMQEYINWRWQVRAHFPTSNQVRLSNGRDRKKLLKYNDSLLADAELLMRKSKSQGVVRTLQKVAERLNPMSVYLEAGKSVLFDAEAPQILSLAQQAKPTPPALATLFSGYVHDSLAGFDNAVIEYTGYWRYRKAFLGDDRPLNASNEDTEAVRNIA